MDLSIDPHSLPAALNAIASLLIDPEGRVRQGRSSRALSSPQDRIRLRSMRQWGDCIAIGRQTSQAEPYAKITAEAEIPLVIYSRTKREITDWQDEFARLRFLHGPRILVEAGPALLEQMIEQAVIDRLYLTRTSRVSSDANSPRFNLELLAASGPFDPIERIEGDEDLFEVYQRRGFVELSH